MLTNQICSQQMQQELPAFTAFLNPKSCFLQLNLTVLNVKNKRSFCELKGTSSSKLKIINLHF